MFGKVFLFCLFWTSLRQKYISTIWQNSKYLSYSSWFLILFIYASMRKVNILEKNIYALLSY